MRLGAEPFGLGARLHVLRFRLAPVHMSSPPILDAAATSAGAGLAVGSRLISSFFLLRTKKQLLPLAICLPVWIVLEPEAAGQGALAFFMVLPYAVYPLAWCAGAIFNLWNSDPWFPAKEVGLSPFLSLCFLFRSTLSRSRSRSRACPPGLSLASFASFFLSSRSLWFVTSSLVLSFSRSLVPRPSLSLSFSLVLSLILTVVLSLSFSLALHFSLVRPAFLSPFPLRIPLCPPLILSLFFFLSLSLSLSFSFSLLRCALVIRLSLSLYSR